MKTMVIIQVGESEELNKELDMVLNKAWDKDIDAKALKIEATITEDHLESIVKEQARNSNGVIIQLPLPKGIDVKRIYNAIPASKNLASLAKEKNINSIIDSLLNNN